jgi:deazaflavin-dependent oxidoreductase (nitroreductase family)
LSGRDSRDLTTWRVRRSDRFEGNRRERRIRRLQKYVSNPPAKLLLELGLLPGVALLETTGRRSGKPRRTPVGKGYDAETDTFWIVAEHGAGAAWVRNVEADPRVRVRIGRRWRSGTAHVLPDDDPRERQRRLGRLGLGKRVNAAAVRVMGTRLLSVRVDLDPEDQRRP